jgi:PIN domain nuclease of toxin-antitoxin system
MRSPSCSAATFSPERERILSAHRCLVSSASIWEVAIKHRLGKLPLPPELLRYGDAVEPL